MHILVNIDSLDLLYFEWFQESSNDAVFVRVATKQTNVLVCIRLAMNCDCARSSISSSSSSSCCFGRAISIRRQTFDNQWACYEIPKFLPHPARYHLSIFNGQDKPVALHIRGPLHFIQPPVHCV